MKKKVLCSEKNVIEVGKWSYMTQFLFLEKRVSFFFPNFSLLPSIFKKMILVGKSYNRLLSLISFKNYHSNGYSTKEKFWLSNDLIWNWTFWYFICKKIISNSMYHKTIFWYQIKKLEYVLDIWIVYMWKWKL